MRLMQFEWQACAKCVALRRQCNPRATRPRPPRPALPGSDKKWTDEARRHRGPVYRLLDYTATAFDTCCLSARTRTASPKSPRRERGRLAEGRSRRKAQDRRERRRRGLLFPQGTLRSQSKTSAARSPVARPLGATAFVMPALALGAKPPPGGLKTARDGQRVPDCCNRLGRLAVGPLRPALPPERAKKWGRQLIGPVRA